MTISSNYTNYNYTNYQSSTDVVSLSIHIVRRLETQFVYTINPWIASLSSGHSSSWSSCSICGSCWLTNLCCVLTQVACWHPGEVIFKCVFNLIEMFLLLTNAADKCCWDCYCVWRRVLVSVLIFLEVADSFHVIVMSLPVDQCLPLVHVLFPVC